MGVQPLFVDAWIREAEEASKLVESLETKISNNPQQPLGDTARSKLFELGVKLDRLESLLHNPPSKPILTDQDLDFRWKMLSDIQLRTREMAHNLYLLLSKDRLESLATVETKETTETGDGDYQDHSKDTLSQEDLELLMPLITDDATRNQSQVRISNSFASTGLLWKFCWVILVILGVAAFLLVLAALVLSFCSSR